MRPFRVLLARIRGVFGRTAFDRDLADEFAAHLDMSAAEYERRGFGPAEARRRARLEAGNLAAAAEACRDRRGFPRLDALLRDLGFAVRSLRRTPGFSAAVLMALTVGLGAATAVFSLLDLVVLRPLPYPNPDRLVAIASRVPGVQTKVSWGIAAHEYFYFRRASHAIANLAVYTEGDVTARARAGAPTEQLHVVDVSASLFPILGIRPVLGQAFTPADSRPPIPATTLIGYDCWIRRFGGDSAVLGRTIDLEGIPVVVAGVLPRGAQLPGGTAADLWLPLHLDRGATPVNQHNLQAVARIRAGTSITDARADLNALTARLPELFPGVYSTTFWNTTHFSTAVTSLKADVVGATVTRALWMLFAAVGLVLIIATANVANLFLVRFEARRREVALRVALGADRARLAWYSVSEGLVLSAIGGTCAIAFAYGVLRLVVSLAPTAIPRVGTAHMPWQGALFAGAGALLLGVILGLVPVIRHGGPAVDVAALRDAARGLTPTASRHRVRNALVVVQVALALVLLAGAGLLLKSFERLRNVHLGFDPHGVLTVRILPPVMAYRTNAQLATLYEQLVQRVDALPGVVVAGVGQVVPLDPELGPHWCQAVHPEGLAPSQEAPCVAARQVSPGYLQALQIHVTGHVPDWGETQSASAGVVVSRALAKRLWPAETPLGRGLRPLRSQPPYYRVVGIADDVHGQGLDQPASEAAYFPLRAQPGAPLWSPRQMTLVVRARTAHPAALTRAIRRITTSLDPGIAIGTGLTMETLVGRSTARQSFAMTLLVVAACIALLLSVVGLFGVVAYVATQRQGEIGIRIALGASAVDVTRLVVGHSMRLAVGGVIVGLAGALAVTRLLRVLLFHVSPIDPVVLSAAAGVLLLVAAAASFAPARRAARIDPVQALRKN